MPTKTYAEVVAEATKSTIDSMKQAQDASMRAVERSFAAFPEPKAMLENAYELAGDLLTVQRNYVVGAVDRLTRAAKKAA